MQEFLNRVIHGNSAEIMTYMPNESVDLTVTSPPYDDLRTYNGYTFPFEEVAKQLYRVTKQGGIVVWVVGDKTDKGSETLTSFKQALYFKEIGFNVHDTMIYAKENWIPLTHNRYEQQFEYMFIFSKGKPKTFNPIKTPTKNGGNIARKVRDYTSEELVKNVIAPDKTIKLEKIKPNIWFYGVGKGVSTTDSIAHQHPAIFPEKLAEDHILSWSNEFDTVLDCFCGSGTTLKMAYLNNRNFIGKW
jgi:site-specific DNA-methyltransferase (adenine-specific)